MRTTPPDGIIVTLPVQFLLDLAESRVGLRNEFGMRYTRKENVLHGYRQCCKEMKSVMKDPDQNYWIHSMPVRPTLSFEFVYFTCLGSIGWRGNLLEWKPGGTLSFPDGRHNTAKHWMLVCNLIDAPGYIPFKGSQGFRYTSKLF